MLLSNKDILKLVKKRKLKITNFNNLILKQASVVLNLDKTLIKYKKQIIDLKNDKKIRYKEIIMDDKGYSLQPQEFILGCTSEKVEIPDGYFGFIETEGNIARSGISSINNDGHISTGFKGKITLEIKNNSSNLIKIYPGMPFVQLFIFKMSSKSSNLYKGKYQNQNKPTIYKIGKN